MENKAHAMAAGIFVALLTALVLGLATWLTRDTGKHDPYEISTKETVTGLAEQAPVRFRGVDVGKVKRVGFDPKVQGNVLIRLDIDREAPLTRDTFATISYQGVTGSAFIQLDDGGQPAPRLVPNDEVPPRIPLRPGLLARLEERGEQILTQVEQVASRVNTLLGDSNQKRVAAALDNLSRAADNTQQLAANLNATVSHKLDPALDQATIMLRGVQRTAANRSARPWRSSARRRSGSMPRAGRSRASRPAPIRWRMRPRPSPPPRCRASIARPTKPRARCARSIAPSTTSRRTRRC